VVPSKEGGGGFSVKLGQSIIVEAVMGAGKTCLTKAMASVLGPETLILLEPDEKDNKNPYLAKYYESPERWCFTMQVHLLTLRLRATQRAQWYVADTGKNAIMDRSLPGDTAFARLQLKYDYMTEMEFRTYSNLYHAMTTKSLLPNVCVRLLVDPDVAIQRIKKRMENEPGRKCEDVVPRKYIEDLDLEIDHMTSVLKSMGVSVFEVPWNKNRMNEQDIQEAAKDILARIEREPTYDLFLDLHRRTTRGNDNS
jgi:deoxyadenosine/deoxycytidine kinase